MTGLNQLEYFIPGQHCYVDDIDVAFLKINRY